MAESLLTSSALFPVSEQRVDSPSFPLSSNIKRQVQRFWQKSPCDSWFTNEPRGTVAFYRSLDEHRYKVHPRLQSAIGFEKTRGLRVLEIGCGCGSEAERFVRAGAYYTAVDLTNAALSITRRRFQLANLKGPSLTALLTSFIPMESFTTRPIHPELSARFTGCSLQVDGPWLCSIIATRSITT